MRDPYDVLGVPRGASDDDIKKAYRKLSRLYHPDANVNNPNKAQAEEKFKEVQQAYQQIQQEKEGGYSSYGPGSSRGGYSSGGGYGSSYGPFGGFGGFGGFGDFGDFGDFAGRRQQAGGSESEVRMQAAANYINSRHYSEALNVLNDIMDRDARWYYLSALANSGAGNNVTARQHAQTAVNMEPGNAQYRQVLNQLENGRLVYEDLSCESYVRSLPAGFVLLYLARAGLHGETASSAAGGIAPVRTAGSGDEDVRIRTAKL